ncbi:luminal-binding protein-like isoform X2 [Corylus avellana]|uniref:luminal-binding protein-like isoform X2 n=1 Tax=Corylus avellana TaxID=13451 RepID=UPI00286D0B81|nr:luminal-binding protein-like isoform X2 [Corylus avellana]
MCVQAWPIRSSGELELIAHARIWPVVVQRNISFASVMESSKIPSKAYEDEAGSVIGTMLSCANDQENSKSFEIFEAGSIIGTNIGTMLYCVSIYKNGQVEIIANDEACVAFIDCENLIGEVAKNQVAVNLERTIFHFKRLIEENFLSRAP